MAANLKFSPLLALLALGACTTLPTGPSILALPGTGKSFDQFRADDAVVPPICAIPDERHERGPGGD